MNNSFLLNKRRVIFMQFVSNKADEVLPRLWLGNKGASQDEHWLRQNNISVIFNCTKDIPFVSTERTLYRVPVDDNLENNEIRNLELWSYEIVYKIAKEYNAGNTILVHCYAGMQRSAACVAMFLIAKTRCTTDEAVSYIRSKRPIAFNPGVNFYRAIKGFETRLREQIGESVADPSSSWRRIPLPK